MELYINGLFGGRRIKMAQFLFLLPPNPRVYSEKSTEVIENSSPPLGISYLGVYSSKRNVKYVS